MMGTMPDGPRRRPRDLNSLAASIVADATDETPDHYTYRVEWSDEDNEWVGLCVELPALSWLDPDKGKALAGIERLVRDVVGAGKDSAAVAAGRKGGLKGGRARADNLTAEQRSEIAKKAATARWNRPD
ncbi:hypothetical protein MSG_00904 [Mycobacterium shigaense]|uniref:Uncharacterized protein n=1 Tax=Mycobacterium shigaense TaxID=722731 RepID=A0A1Z4EDN3_9MYCO|nr:hypothetical protein MSG_00904 [Mycobacterium shigaense]